MGTIKFACYTHTSPFEKSDNFDDDNKTPWLMEPGGSMRIHKGSPIIPILNRINPIISIDSYLFKVHSNIVFLLKSLFSAGSTNSMTYGNRRFNAAFTKVLK